MKMVNYVYGRQVRGNVLIVCRTGCGKTYFIKKSVTNNFFSDLVKAEWVSYIQLDKTSETKIQFRFNCDIEFHYPRDKEPFEKSLNF